MPTEKFADEVALLQSLLEAKSNVLWLLDHPNGNVDMKGLQYWAGRVVELRALIVEVI